MAPPSPAPLRATQRRKRQRQRKRKGEEERDREREIDIEQEQASEKERNEHRKGEQSEGEYSDGGKGGGEGDDEHDGQTKRRTEEGAHFFFSQAGAPAASGARTRNCPMAAATPAGQGHAGSARRPLAPPCRTREYLGGGHAGRAWPQQGPTRESRRGLTRLRQRERRCQRRLGFRKHPPVFALALFRPIRAGRVCR